MIRIVLVDDEKPAVERLKKLLKNFNDVQIVGEANDGIAALELIEQQKPDMVFLDIEMPELGGLEVAKSLGISGPAIVFATAYDEHALAAFEANAIDYLVKPVNIERLTITIQKLNNSHRKTNGAEVADVIQKISKNSRPLKLAIKIGNRFEIVDPSQIAAALAKDHYTAILVNGKERLIDDSLDALSSKLNSQVFFRAHRSAIINLNFLKELRREGDRKYVAVLKDDAATEVQVSKERLPELKVYLGLL